MQLHVTDLLPTAQCYSAGHSHTEPDCNMQCAVWQPAKFSLSRWSHSVACPFMIPVLYGMYRPHNMPLETSFACMTLSCKVSSGIFHLCMLCQELVCCSGLPVLQSRPTHDPKGRQHKCGQKRRYYSCHCASLLAVYCPGACVLTSHIIHLLQHCQRLCADRCFTHGICKKLHP